METLGDWSVVVHAHGWMDQRTHSFFKVRGEAIRCVKAALEEAGIELPEPSYRVDLRPASAGEPVERRRPAVPVRPAGRVDLSRDTHLDREIAEERARMRGGDLLQPDAPAE